MLRPSGKDKVSNNYKVDRNICVDVNLGLHNLCKRSLTASREHCSEMPFP